MRSRLAREAKRPPSGGRFRRAGDSRNGYSVQPHSLLEQAFVTTPALNFSTR